MCTVYLCASFGLPLHSRFTCYRTHVQHRGQLKVQPDRPDHYQPPSPSHTQEGIMKKTTQHIITGSLLYKIIMYRQGGTRVIQQLQQPTNAAHPSSRRGAALFLKGSYSAACRLFSSVLSVVFKTRLQMQRHPNKREREREIGRE